MHSFSLTQVVTSHIHVSHCGNTSLIDLVMLSHPEHLQCCTTEPPLSTSDRLGVSVALKWKSHGHYISKPRLVWLYNNADFSAACDIIDRIDWKLIQSYNLDTSTELWTKTFLAIMEECIPCVTIKRRKNLPWLNSNIVRNMFRKAKRNHKQQHLLLYKKLRNEVVT